jgi:TPR repeat protein
MNMPCIKFSPLIAPRLFRDTSRPCDTLHDDSRHPRYGGRCFGAAVAAVLTLVFFLQGGHAPRDAQEIAWLNQLATANNPDVQLQLGLVYQEGRYKLVPDNRNGPYRLERAARNGQGYAADLLAGRPMTGNAGAARTPVHGHLDALATQLKSPILVTVSALWKILRLGLTADQSSAALQQRAHAGNPVAEFQLAMWYPDGAWSVERDLVKRRIGYDALPGTG